MATNDKVNEANITDKVNDLIGLNKEQINILDKIPYVYQLIMYSVLVLHVNEAVVEASRESGKTIFLYMLALIYAELFPEGDIIITRDKQNEHLRGVVPRIKAALRDSWLIELMPNLRSFTFDEKELWFSRVHPNGHVQKIWCIGEKMGGLQKNKSVSPDGYFSIVLKDEAETNNDIEGVASVQERQQLTEDKKRTYRRRDTEKYKDLTKYPPTKFMYFYNPKEENGEFEEIYDLYLPVNIKQLRDKGFQIVVIPNYKNGSGLVLMRNNIYNLINDKPMFRPSPESIKEAAWFEENAPEIHKMDYLGIRWDPGTAFFGHYKPAIRDKIDEQFIPISLGVDQGLSDNAGIVLNANEYILNEQGKMELTQINGAIESFDINGRKLMTAEESRHHIIYTAEEIVRYLVDNVFVNDKWNKFYREESFIIATGHKDAWLLSSIQDLFDNNPDYNMYADLIEYEQIRGVVSYYDLDSRVKLEQEQHKRRTNIIIPETNKKLEKAYYKYSTKNWKNDKYDGLNLIDAYFYSKHKFYTTIKTDDEIVYNTYIREIKE